MASDTEHGSEVLPRLTEPVVLDGDDLRVNARILVPADELADADPIGGLEERAAALAFDEGFQQHRLEAITLLPVVGHLAAGDGQHLGGQAFAFNPRQDEEPRVVQHQVQVLEPLRLLPADEAVAYSEFPGARAKAEQGHELVASVHVVAQLAARHGCPTWLRSPVSDSTGWSRSTSPRPLRLPPAAASKAGSRARPAATRHADRWPNI